jgi:tetratricopeptide (TPR) repeat protein
MRIKLILITILLISSVCSKAQIDYNDHIKAVELNNEAIKEIKKGNKEIAQSYLTEAIYLDSTFRNPYIALNSISTDKNISILKEYLQKATEIFIEDDEILYYLGNLYRKENNIDSAIIAYSKAIKYSKINGEDYPIVYAYYLNRGICYLKIQSFISALQDFNYGIRLNPKKPALYLNKAKLLYELGNKKQACTQWEIASELGNKNAKTYLQKYCQ